MARSSTGKEPAVQLDGIHHITAVTADAQRNVDFYRGVLGLRLVKKTVNFDAPRAYHLYYGDDLGDPGSILTFFEFRGIEPGHAGDGMSDEVAWKVPPGSAKYWKQRLEAAGVTASHEIGTVEFEDPEGLRLKIVETVTVHEGLASSYGDVPHEHALRGFDAARALVADPRPTGDLLQLLGFERPGEPYAYTADGRTRYAMRASAQEGSQGAGTVHHIAWACRPEDQEAWRNELVVQGINVTRVIDRTYFRSIYFREPGGVLFEIATEGPGFTVDEAPDELGTALKLPPQHEPLRAVLERELVPIEAPSP
jgi:glyoxalase family protein